MDAFFVEHMEDGMTAIVDPFMDVEPDAFDQTGSDWYNLMLSASLGNIPVHGTTTAATCETLAKQTESFAAKHACGRIGFDEARKTSEHAGDEWYYANLKGRSFHGTKTTNRARLLFDSGEWEPSQRTRAKNAAFIGAILTTGGASLESALTMASAIAGEQIPADAITRTELPMQVIKREAAAASKPNHIVYGHGNAQRAIQWEDSQFRQEVLPPNAAADWSRVTTIARYIGEANAMVDPQYQAYASLYGVPYSLVVNSWATVSSADYILDPGTFEGIDVTAAEILPTSALLHAYDNHAEALYDAIHRVTNEMALGMQDPTLDSLVRAAEGLRRKPGKTRLATGTYLLSEPTLHRYGAEKAAEAVGGSARSWDALTKAGSELVLSKRTLHSATNSAVLAYRERQYFDNHLEPLLAELCHSAIWLRANSYLSEMLANQAIARDRITKLKRTILGNSAPLSTNVILTARIRSAARMPALNLARRIIAGDIPKLKIAVDARYNVGTQSIADQRLFVASLAKHLETSKQEWVRRYQSLAAAYSLRNGPSDVQRAVEFGSAAKAFETVTGYLITQVDSGFVDPNTLGSSYLFHIAKNYARKRHIVSKDFGDLLGKTAAEQAIILDQILVPPISFVHVEDFCNTKLSLFYNDIVAGVEPMFADSSPPPETPLEEPKPTELDPNMLALVLELLDAPTPPRANYDAVLNTYDSEKTADAHARANGYATFLDAYAELGEKARMDKETSYTTTALNHILKNERLTDDATANDQPVI